MMTPVSVSMRRLAVCTLAFLPLSLSAARTCRVLFLGDQAAAPEALQLFDGKGCQPIDLPRMNLSQPYKLPEGALTLTLLTAPPKEKEPIPPGAPSVSVADGVDSFYLLVTPDKANKVTPVKVQLIDAASAQFKAGQMMWYNLTALDVFGTMGTQKVSIKARSKTIMDAPINKPGDYNVDLSYHLANDPATYPICETHWIHDPAARSVVFLLTEPGTKIPRVLSFRDNPIPKDKDKEKPQ